MSKKKRPPRAAKAPAIISTSPWISYERVWAENGMVKILGKDGKVDTLTVAEAGLRASAMNNATADKRAPMPADQIRKTLYLLDNLIPIIREAKSQIERKDDKKTILLSHLVEGKNPDGSPLAVPKTPDELMAYLTFRFSFLKEDEIKTVIAEKNLSIAQKCEMLAIENDRRIRDTLPHHPQKA